MVGHLQTVALFVQPKLECLWYPYKSYCSDSLHHGLKMQKSMCFILLTSIRIFCMCIYWSVFNTGYLFSLHAYLYE